MHSTVTPPRQLLLSALQAKDGLVSAKEFANLTSEEWQELIKVSTSHRVAPLLHHRLKSLKVEVPLEVEQTLRNHYLENACKNIKLNSVVKNILEQFQRDSIPNIPLKGLFLSQYVYENIALRSMSDVDLLIPEQDVKRAEKIILEAGFHPLWGLEEVIPEEYQLGYYHPTQGICIELHWNLSHTVNGINYGIKPDIEGVWKRATPCQIQNVPVLALTIEDHLLYLCIHASNHIFAHGLRALYDIKATIDCYLDIINWDILFTRAKEWGGLRSLYMNLWLAKKLLNAKVPEEFLMSIKPKNLDKDTLMFAEECFFINTEEPEKALPQADGLVQLWKETNILEKFRQLWKNIFPSRHFLSTRYTVSPNSWKIFLYYPVRVKDLLARYGKIALQLIRKDSKTMERANFKHQIDQFRIWLLSS